MILGLGVDLCNVERLSRACESEAFVRRVFTEKERLYAEGKASRALHLAGAFAAKEAFAKATGQGLARIGLQNVGVEHDLRGVPRLSLNFNAEELQRFSKGHFHLSITHDGGYAVAVVIYESREDCDNP